MTALRVSDDIELRLLTEDDAPRLFSLVDDNRAHLGCWLPWVGSNVAVGDSLAFIEMARAQFAKDRTMQAGIFYLGQLVGMCGLLPFSTVNDSVMIGYWLVLRSTRSAPTCSPVSILVCGSYILS